MVSVLDAHYLGISAIVTVGMQLFFWSIANALKFDKVTDIAGSMNFVVLAWLTFLLSGTYYTRQIVILAMVTVWGLRLGLYLLSRVIKRGKDERFDEMRENFWSFLGFWVFQMIWVFTVSLSVIFVQSASVDVAIGARDIIGWILWSIGFVVEALADSSKSAFNDNPANKGRLLQDNVWYYSRHPNYFGEIVIWLGLFLSASSVFSANTTAAYVSVLSPIMTFIFLAFLSGIPPAEERYDKRFGSDPIYIDYKTRTSPLIPFPPQCYRSLPTFMKLLICLELPMYSRHFREPTSQSLHSGTPPSSKIVAGVV